MKPTTRKPSLAQLTRRRSEEIERQAETLAASARQIGTAGQADAIASLPPLEAAYTAIRCFLVRLGLDDVARRLREHPLSPGRMRHETIAGGPIDSTVELRAAEDGR